MATTEKLEKRVQTLKERFHASAEPTEDTPPHARPRQVRKQLKRAQRKLRALKGLGHHGKKKEAPQGKEGAEKKEGAPPAKG